MSVRDGLRGKVRSYRGERLVICVHGSSLEGLNTRQIAPEITVFVKIK